MLTTLLTTHSGLKLTRPDGQLFCHVYHDEPNDWLRATWCGFVAKPDGQRGAEAILHLLARQSIPCLLNDNNGAAGPWFDSVEWLQRVWAPQAGQLGLRYVAHVLQPHAEVDALPYFDSQPFAASFELQLFSEVCEAEDWLHHCQQVMGN